MVFVVLLCYCIMWYDLVVVNEVTLSLFLFLSVTFLVQGPFDQGPRDCSLKMTPRLNKGIKKKLSSDIV